MSDKGASRSKIVAAFAAIYLIWGSTYLGIRFAIETIPPFLMGGVRFLIAGAILYTVMRSRGAENRVRSIGEIRRSSALASSLAGTEW